MVGVGVVGAVDNWGGCVSVGQGVYGKPLYLPLNFSVKRTVKKKNEVFKKIPYCEATKIVIESAIYNNIGNVL